MSDPLDSDGLPEDAASVELNTVSALSAQHASAPCHRHRRAALHCIHETVDETLTHNKDVHVRNSTLYACVLRAILSESVLYPYFMHVRQVNLVSDSDDDDDGPSTARTGRKRPGATQRAAGQWTTPVAHAGDALAAVS